MLEWNMRCICVHTGHKHDHQCEKLRFKWVCLYKIYWTRKDINWGVRCHMWRLQRSLRELPSQWFACGFPIWPNSFPISLWGSEIPHPEQAQIERRGAAVVYKEPLDVSSLLGYPLSLWGAVNAWSPLTASFKVARKQSIIRDLEGNWRKTFVFFIFSIFAFYIEMSSSLGEVMACKSTVDYCVNEGHVWAIKWFFLIIDINIHWCKSAVLHQFRFKIQIWLWASHGWLVSWCFNDMPAFLAIFVASNKLKYYKR